MGRSKLHKPDAQVKAPSEPEKTFVSASGASKPAKPRLGLLQVLGKGQNRGFAPEKAESASANYETPEP
jgi:hypothetical protein